VNFTDDIAGSANRLLLRRKGELWRSPQIQAYNDEQMLKLLLRDSSQLLPTYVEGTVTVDEFTVPFIGSVDLVTVGPQGNITLVECKLSSNSEIRRSVIGQIFAYASGCWRMSFEDFSRAFSSRNQSVSLTNAVRNALPPAHRQQWEEDAFQLSVTENLKAGRFTLIIAVDRITDELKRIIPYVNSHTVAEVQFLALELGYVRDGDVELVRPLTYGSESVADKRNGGPRRFWTADAYFEKLKEYPSRVRAIVEALITFSEQRGAEMHGGSGSLPSLNVSFRFGDKRKTLWSSYYYGKGPTFDLNFEYIRSLHSSEALANCARTLQSIAGVENIYERVGEEFRVRPSIPIDPILMQQGALETVQRALTELLAAERL
jgi:hypothetical protein